MKPKKKPRQLKDRKKIIIGLEPVKPTLPNAMLAAGYLVGFSMRDFANAPLDDWDRKMLQNAGQYMRWFAEQMK